MGDRIFVLAGGEKKVFSLFMKVLDAASGGYSKSSTG
jgi:hypothetical protein